MKRFWNHLWVSDEPVISLFRITFFLVMLIWMAGFLINTFNLVFFGA